MAKTAGPPDDCLEARAVRRGVAQRDRRSESKFGLTGATEGTRGGNTLAGAHFTYRADAQYWRNAKWKEAEAATAAAASAPAGVGDQSDVYVSTKADKRCRDDDATEEEAAEEAVGENEAENITSWGAAARGTPPGPA